MLECPRCNHSCELKIDRFTTCAKCHHSFHTFSMIGIEPIIKYCTKENTLDGLIFCLLKEQQMQDIETDLARGCKIRQVALDSYNDKIKNGLIEKYSVSIENGWAIPQVQAQAA